ncbi:MAG: ADP-ribosylglycohydrolase family protein [Gammaproteobacteria bacterium]|nr:ADP-ribosylglycohydrolase family protein [Gammaproteobacteria bacterium]
MLGAVAGDVIGSVYEGRPTKSRVFPLFTGDSTFTDDTVLTVAVADALLHGKEYAGVFHDYVARYPAAGYGASFAQWALRRSPRPYGSFGNGSAMRVSPVAWARDDLAAVLEEASKSAMVTHDHPEGLKGAAATAAAVYLARQGCPKVEIRRYLSDTFGYRLDRSVDEIRPDYSFDVSCQGSVPESIICFLEAEDFEQAVRNAVSLGGDADTMACIAGAIAEAFFGDVPAHIADEVRRRLDARLIDVIDQFRSRFC